MKFFPGKNIDFFLTCRQNREAVSQVANILSFEPIIVINRIGANRIYTSLSRLSLTTRGSPSLLLRFCPRMSKRIRTRVTSRSPRSRRIQRTLQLKKEKNVPRRPEKYASRDASSIALSSAIFSPRVRNFSFFFFYIRDRFLKRYLSISLSLSLPVFSDREEENGRGVAPKATNEREKRKGKESLERSNKTRASIHGWKPVEKSFSRSSLSDQRSSMRVRVIRVSNVTRGSVARSKKNNLEMKREES